MCVCVCVCVCVFQHLAKSRHLLKIYIQKSSREETRSFLSLISPMLLLGLHFPTHGWLHRSWTARKWPTLLRLGQHLHPYFLWFPKDMSSQSQQEIAKDHDDPVPAPPSSLSCFSFSFKESKMKEVYDSL